VGCFCQGLQDIFQEEFLLDDLTVTPKSYNCFFFFYYYLSLSDKFGMTAREEIMGLPILMWESSVTQS